MQQQQQKQQQKQQPKQQQQWQLESGRKWKQRREEKEGSLHCIDVSVCGERAC